MSTEFATAVAAPVAALEVTAVDAGYGRTTVLREVSMSVLPGTVTAVLGANGAGKTTLLRTVSGLLRPMRGQVLVGGVDVTRRPPHERARRGLCSIPEGRGVFRSLTTRENLVMSVPPWRRGTGLDQALDAFPDLRPRLDQHAGRLSGGQQQMLALARAYLADPAVVLVDEVSMGLAPRIIDDIFRSLKQLVRSGVALVIVEQYVLRALEIADQVVLLEHGSVAYCGPADGVDDQALVRSYLGPA